MATNLNAAAKLAAEAAVQKKQSLDSFRSKQGKEHTAYIHKTAAYLEIKLAAKEARKAKAERKAADAATTVSKAKKKEAQQDTLLATALEEKSKKDKAAALREAKLAAKTGLTMHPPALPGVEAETTKRFGEPVKTAQAAPAVKTPGDSLTAVSPFRLSIGN